jgi:tetratricopeptide (TPR) repeat protein
MDNQQLTRAHELRELGELARNSYDLETAQAHYEQAVTLLRTSDDQLKLAHTIRHLGDVHAERRNWPAAEECLAEALSIYRSHPSPSRLDLANAIRSHAVLHTATGQPEKARALFLEAGDLYRSLGIAAGVEECRRKADQLG